MQKESPLYEKYDFLKPLKQPASLFIFISLIIYGTLYHISSSEFWPITMSKTWLPGESFEYSMLQKPLFSLFLSFFHVLPLSDVTHLLLLKVIFSLLGFCSIYLFVESIKNFENDYRIQKSTQLPSDLSVFILCLMSPTILNNFFRIRADQLSFFVFTLFLYHLSKKNRNTALFFALILPLISIKSLIYAPMLLLFLYFAHQEKTTTIFKKNKLILSLLILTIVIWVIALNIHSFYYFLETFRTNQFPNEHLKRFFINEWPLLISSALVSMQVIISNHKSFTGAFGVCSLLSLIFILLIPQSYPFFIASLLPLVFAPLISKLIHIHLTHSLFKNKKLLIIILFFILYPQLVKTINDDNNFYISNKEQLQFIDATSKWLTEYPQLTYLDGMGTMPKQNFSPCFVSPDDLESNSSCNERLKAAQPDIIILTRRLAYLKETVFSALNKDYFQIAKNIWVKKNLTNQLKSLPKTNSIQAILIFGFDG